jgi:hypothetical protein
MAEGRNKINGKLNDFQLFEENANIFENGKLFKKLINNYINNNLVM